MSRQLCATYRTLRRSGVSHYAADNLCKQAHKLKLDPRLSASQILNAIAIKDKVAPVSSYPDDDNTNYDLSQFDSKESCISGLINEMGIDDDVAIQRCTAQFQFNSKDNSSPSIKQASRNSNSKQEIPAWAIIEEYRRTGGYIEPASISNLKSASSKNDKVRVLENAFLSRRNGIVKVISEVASDNAPIQSTITIPQTEAPIKSASTTATTRNIDDSNMPSYLITNKWLRDE